WGGLFPPVGAGLGAGPRQALAAALAAVGATAILVTHDQPEALSMGHRVAVLRQGRIVQTAGPEELYRLPADAELARFIGEAVLLPGPAPHGSGTRAPGPLPARGPGARG